MHAYFVTKAKRWMLALALLLPLSSLAQQFVEISAEIETRGYRLGDTNSIAKAKPKIFSVFCITGSGQWYIEDDFSWQQKWLFDGTNVVCKAQTKAVEDWSQLRASRDGLPLGDFGVNLPWLAFCSGSFLQREGRTIPLTGAVLQDCPDRFAYKDMTTTFPDEFGLPRSLDLFTSKALFLKSHTDWDKEHSFGDRYTKWNEQTALKIQDGILVFHYAVLESTNLLGRTFPTRFEFFQTGRQFEQDGNWLCQGAGRVKSIRPSNRPPAFRP